jgi:hypothetical protein
MDYMLRHPLLVNVPAHVDNPLCTRTIERALIFNINSWEGPRPVRYDFILFLNTWRVGIVATLHPTLCARYEIDNVR